MTNLHLGNRRGDADAVAARMGAEAWSAALRTCERAVAVFGKSLHVGVDLLVGPDWAEIARNSARNYQEDRVRLFNAVLKRAT